MLLLKALDIEVSRQTEWCDERASKEKPPSTHNEGHGEGYSY